MSEVLDRFKRAWLRNHMLKTTRERSFVHVRKASKMGVLYKADQEYSETLVKKLNKWCENHHIQLLAMGYVNEKELKVHSTPHRNSDFFCNKHLNKLKLPVKADFVRFAEEPMDYLIYLSEGVCMPLLGICSFSDANFRIGPHLPEYEFCFDLMLKTNASDAMKLADEILTYLENFGHGKI